MSPPSGRELLRQSSRRDLLRACGVGLATFAGCVGRDDAPESANKTTTTLSATTTTESRTTTTTESTTDETTTMESRLLQCTTVSLPDEGWPLPDRDSTNSNYAPSSTGPTATPSVRWKQTAEPYEGDVTVPAAFTDPVVAGRQLFVGRSLRAGPNRETPDGNTVNAYDRKSGKQRWTYSINDQLQRSLAVAGDSVFVNAWKTVHVIDRATGTNRWTFEPDDWVTGVVPVGERVYVGTENALVAFGHDGSTTWTTGLDQRLTTPPAVRGGTVFVGTESDSLVAFRADDGRRVWSANLNDDSDEYDRLDDIVLMECTIVASVGKKLYAIDRDGSVRWKTEGGYSSFATDGEVLFAGTGDGWVRSLDVGDGGLRWERYLGIDDSRKVDGVLHVTLADNTVYVPARPDALYALDPSDGGVRWKVTPDIDGSPGSPVVVRDTIFTSGEKHLVALD